MSNRARLTPMDAKATFSALDRLVGDHSTNEVPVEELPLERIKANPRQPRERESDAFSDASIDELAASIKEHGVLQAILVRNVGRYFQIIAGERRYRACLKLGMPAIPARVIDVKSDEHEMELSLVENLQRQNLSPLEEAKIYRQMIDDLGYTYRSLAERIGKSLGYVDTRLKLLAYPDVADAVQHLNIGVGEARELARVEDDDLRQDLIRRVSDGSMDREELQQTVRGVVGRPVQARDGDSEAYDVTQLPLSRLRRSLESALTSLDEIESLGTAPDWDAALLQLLQAVAERAESVVRTAVNGDLAVSEREESAEVPVASQAVTVISAGERPAEVDEDGEEQKRAVDFAKAFRHNSNHATLELISRYWTALERRGYTFHLGQWYARCESGSVWRVFLDFAIDGQQYTAEWQCNVADRTMLPANAPARILLGQRS